MAFENIQKKTKDMKDGSFASLRFAKDDKVRRLQASQFRVRIMLQEMF